MSRQSLAGYKNGTAPFRLKSEVTIRDNFSCQLCGKKGHPVKYAGIYWKAIDKKNKISFEVHHLISGIHYLENMVLLCRLCHKTQFHTNEGRRIWLG